MGTRELIALGCIVAAISLLFGRQTVFHSHGYKRDQQELRWYTDTIIRKQGVTSLYGNSPTGVQYCFWSIDGGKTWFSVDEKDDGRKVVSVADPGLLKAVLGVDELMDYVNRNGPLDFSGERAADDLRLLQGSGFTVQVGDKGINSVDQLPTQVR